MKQVLRYASVLTALALSACGGGGESTTPKGGGDPKPISLSAPDTTPDSQQFEPWQANRGERVSRSFQVTGINTPVIVRIEGGEYAIDGGSFTSRAGIVNNNQTITVRMQASNAFETSTEATLTLGAETFSFTTVTPREDTTPIDPEPKPITLQPGEVGFTTIWVDGINTSVVLTIKGGEYSLDGGNTFTDQPGEVENGQQLVLRTQSSNALSAPVVVDLSIGDKQFEWVVTTIDEDLIPEPVALSSRDNVLPGSEQLSDVFTIAGISGEAPIAIHNGQYSLDGGDWTSAEGTVRAGQSVQLRQIASTQSATTVTTVFNVSVAEIAFTVSTVTDINPPTGEIIFPWLNSRTEKELLTVRGIARDDSEIAEITLAGQAVSIDEVRRTESGTELVWSIDLVPQTLPTRYQLSISDIHGNSSDQADEITLAKIRELPREFIVDKNSSRLIGLNRDSGLVEYDYATRRFTDHSVPTFGSKANTFCLSGENDVFFISLSQQRNSITSYNLESKAGRDWGLIPYPQSEYDQNIQQFIHALACDETRVLVLTRASTLDGNETTRLLQLDLANPDQITEIAETGDANVGDWTIDTMRLANNLLFTGNSRNANSAIQIFDLETAALATLVENVSFSTMEWLQDTSELIIVDETRVRKYHLASQNFIALDEPAESQIVSLSGTGSSGLLPDGRLLVQANYHDALVSIDINTGQRELFHAQQLGHGDKLLWSISGEISSEHETAYVYQRGDHTNPKITAVDLATGNRTMLYRVVTTGVSQAQASAYNTSTNTLYFGDVQRGSSRIMSYNISNYELTTVSSSTQGFGAPLGGVFGLEWDPSNQRLLAADAESASLLAINTATGERTILSKQGLRGDGPAIDATFGIGLSLNAETNAVYLSNENGGNILSVDLASGHRNIFLEECNVPGYGDVINRSVQTLGIKYDPYFDRLILTGAYSILYSLQSNTCRVLDYDDVSFNDFIPTETGLIGVASNALYFLDEKSEQAVIISK